MRLGLCLVLLTACDGPAATRDHPIDWDASTCAIGALDILAPKPELHYDPDLYVVLELAEIDPTQLVFDMVDDTGTTYQWSSWDGSQPADDAGLWVHDEFHYQLAPSHRYELTVSSCGDYMKQSVEFFTSPAP